jgi:uncharacterized protein (TIGR01244 family)
MRRPLIPVAFALSAITPALASAQHFTGTDKLTKLSAPVLLDTTGMFQAKIARVGDDMFVGGQPTEKALREMLAQGVTTVVNLRTPVEMTRSVKFDEPALVAQLGMKYVYLPVRGDTAYPYAPETVKKFSQAVRESKGKVLLHCTVGWRASHLWAAYLIQERGVPVEEALANASAINLGGRDPRMPGRQPIEDFLNRDLPSLGRSPH